MGKVIAVLGWGFAVVATAFWLSARNANSSLKTELETLSAQHAQSLARMSAQEERLAKLSGNVSEVTGKLDHAQFSVTMLEDILDALPNAAFEDLSNLPIGNQAGTLEDLQTEEDADEEEKAETENPFAAIFSGGMSDELLFAAAKMGVQTQYGEFLATLGSEQAEQARLVITDILLNQSELGMSALSGESSADELADTDYEQWMIDELALFLTTEELAAFEEYQATLPERLLEQSYGMQLTMYAPGLSDEYHALVLDVLIEEMLYFQTGGEDSSFTASTSFDGMLDVYGRVRERLAGALPEDQQVIAEQFLEYQEAMIEMMLPLMESIVSETN